MRLSVISQGLAPRDGFFLTDPLARGIAPSGEMADWAETLLGGAPKLVARCVVRRDDWCPTELSWGSAAGTMTASTAKLRAVATVGGSAQDS